MPICRPRCYRLFVTRTTKLTELEAQINALDSIRGKLIHRKGGWLIGQGAFSYGYDLLNDLLPNKSYFHVLVLNATGKMPSDALCHWLEAIFICLSWPDPRIWCNTIGSLGGTAGASVLASTAAGLVASESKLYGPRTLIGGMEFIQKCGAQIEDGHSLDAAMAQLVVKSRGVAHVPGYARPIANGDARVGVMLEYAQKLGFERGRYVQLSLQVESYLLANYNQSMNVGGYVSAFLADQALSSKEVYSLFPTMVSSGVTACYVEDAGKPAGEFLPLRCDDIDYVGPPPRAFPKNGSS